MKSVHYKSRSNERISNTIKIKATKTDKKPPNNRQRDISLTEEESVRPEISCSAKKNSTWIPSKDWHNYLSENQHSLKPTDLPNPPPKAFRNPSPRPKTDWSDCVNKPASLHLTKPPDELLSLKLPSVNFCSDDTPEEESLTKVAPNISDLCEEDKRKIALLVQELAKYKQEKQEDEEKIISLKNKITELKTSLKNTIATAKHSEDKTKSVIRSLQSSEQTALKKQLIELNHLLVQMQVQKATSDVQVKTITAQAEKMTRALHALHHENTDLQVELRLTKERLSVVQQAVDKMSKDLREVQENITVTTEDKACQSSEDIGSERICVKTIEMGDTMSEDQQILTELFFNKSLIQNNFTPKETIIFLPSGDYNESFTNDMCM